MKKKKLNIKQAIKKPGALRSALGIKAGNKIPASKLNKAKKTGTKFPKAPKLGVRKQIYKSMLGLFK